MNWFLTLVFGLGTSIGGALALDWARRNLGARYLKAIFNLAPGEVVIVVPHRGLEPGSIMPRVAVEDVLALKNILFLLHRIRWAGPVRIKDITHLNESDKRQNLISLGGAKVNPFTVETLRRLPPSELIEFFLDPATPNSFQLRRGPVTTYSSPAYSVPTEAGTSAARSDVGVVVKLRNQLNPEALVFVIAGIRGIGTWGAAEFLRKHSQEVHRRKGRQRLRKTGDFSMVIVTEYSDFDITESHIKDFIDL